MDGFSFDTLASLVLVLGLVFCALAYTCLSGAGKAAPWYSRGLKRNHFAGRGWIFIWIAALLIVAAFVYFASEAVRGFAAGWHSRFPSR
ncbi:MAG TPA: hypothetical protein PLR32_07375 [candidate division Zixibacteria bacterium]|nr:hypothetical protein [candidate division Zixibacteria bacterium]MDD4918976.1 hypothetical protein [candidate division Zixibacteria bacterium]MDM7972913.1 hypothetical protein [candidate division Zixibacteria bacterium]HOD67379.1 hypothetical protein [candidate division Zixibacteria bacterium]HOZ07928.1 hypothetical protein [candidate division Zixibacteria bacterium]